MASSTLAEPVAARAARPVLRRGCVRLLVVVAVLTLVREIMIRRHEADLHQWPRRTADPTVNGDSSAATRR